MMIPSQKMVVLNKPISTKISALETVNEMIDYGLSSSTSAPFQSLISQTILDPSDYDGTVSYYFEIIGYNNSATNYDILLKSGSDTYATIQVPANQTAPIRLRSAAFTPATGENTYFVEMPQTGTNNNVRVYAARIIVVQTGVITKTRLQVPLTAPPSSGTNYANVDTQSSGGTQISVQSRGNFWLRDDTKMASYRASNPFRYVIVGKTNDPSGVATFGLKNMTDGTIITDADLTTSNTTFTVVGTYLNPTATNFHDLDAMSAYYKSNSTSYSTSLGKARLYVYLENLSKVEVIRRVAGAIAQVGALQFNQSRHLIDLNNYPNAKIYFETTGSCLDNATAISLGDAGTSDSIATADSEINGSAINFNSSTLARVRSGALALVDDNRVFAYCPITTNTKTINGAYLIINL